MTSAHSDAPRFSFSQAFSTLTVSARLIDRAIAAPDHSATGQSTDQGFTHEVRVELDAGARPRHVAIFVFWSSEHTLFSHSFNGWIDIRWKRSLIGKRKPLWICDGCSAGVPMVMAEINDATNALLCSTCHDERNFALLNSAATVA